MELRFVLTFILINVVANVANDDCFAVANCRCVYNDKPKLFSNFGNSTPGPDPPPAPPANNGIPIPFCKESVTLSAFGEVKNNYTLECEKVELNGKEYDTKPPNGTFHLRLKYPCPEEVKSSSGGGTFLLILLITALCYLTLGVAYNFACMGARGFEIIPNVSFWRDLPSLVKDGYVFVRNGMKVPTNETSSRSPDSYNAI